MPKRLVSLAFVFAAVRISAHPVFEGTILSSEKDLLPAYDYVVVGAGASGLTVANRLSEQPSMSCSYRDIIASNTNSETTVLVIEAGSLYVH